MELLAHCLCAWVSASGLKFMLPSSTNYRCVSLRGYGFFIGSGDGWMEGWGDVDRGSWMMMEIWTGSGSLLCLIASGRTTSDYGVVCGVGVAGSDLRSFTDRSFLLPFPSFFFRFLSFLFVDGHNLTFFLSQTLWFSDNDIHDGDCRQ